MNVLNKGIESTPSLLERAKVLYDAIFYADYDKDTMRQYILHHTSRGTKFGDAINFILKNDKIDSAEYLKSLVTTNIRSMKSLVNALEDDGKVRVHDDVWGFIDLEEDVNVSLKIQINKLLKELQIAENNPKRKIDTSISNLGVVKMSFNDSKCHLYSVQRTTEVGKTAIDEKVKSWRRVNNEAYIVAETRYRINPEYDFFIVDDDGALSVFIRDFRSFENTANFNEAQNRNVKKGLETLVADNVITEREKDKLSQHVHNMGVREKSHLIKSISAGQYKQWTSLKDQQDIANKSMPDDLKWKMKFDSEGSFLFDGGAESLSQFVRFISHTIVKSASDERYIRDISGWIEA